MDWQLPGTVETALTGCHFRLTDMEQALRQAIAEPQVAQDLCTLLEAQSL